MKIKFPFGHYLGRMLAAFLIGAVLIAFTLYYSFDTRLRPTAQETISLFIAASYQEGKAHEAWSLLKDDLSDNILQFRLYSYDTTNDGFKTAYQYQGRSCDVVILPESLLNDDLSLFWDIPNEDAYRNKGILIHSKDGTTSSMGSYFTYHEDNYYAFFNISSLHVSSLDATKGDNEAFVLVESLRSH